MVLPFGWAMDAGASGRSYPDAGLEGEAWPLRDAPKPPGHSERVPARLGGNPLGVSVSAFRPVAGGTWGEILTLRTWPVRGRS